MQEIDAKMGSKIQNVRYGFLLENIDVLFALVIVILAAFFLVGRFLLAEGTILFGDFTPTLELRQFLRANYPVWSNRNSLNYVGSMRLPYLLIFYFPFYIADTSAEVFFKFMIVSTFVLSGFSMYVAARHFIKKLSVDEKTVFLCSMTSSFFYAFNPWVMDRVYHIFLLTTYSFLPLILLISIQIFDKDKVDLKRVLALVLLCSFASTSPHSIFLILLLIVSLYAFFLLLEREQFVSKTKNFVLFILLYALINAFWILPLVEYSLSTGSLHPDYIIHLNDIHTLSKNSQLFNVFTLVAYWWPKVNHSFETYPLNVLWVFASFIIPVVCFLALILYQKNKVVSYLSFLSVVLIFLASGMRFPLPGFYEWLCFDAPVLASFGWLFRDPNKWTLLLSLAYSILFAFACLGVVRLIGRVKRTLFRKLSLTVFMFLLFSLVFVYVTPSAVNYFNGPFKPVKIPSEIYRVNSWLENDSASYQVLWLPSYAEYGATWVYKDLSGAFELDSSAKPTFDFASKYSRGYFNYFSRVLLENRNDCVASYLNPLNVRYIIFHNDSASEGYASCLFQSLQHQKNLKLVKHDGTVYVFENKGWSENVFKICGKVVAVGGGFDKLASLTALKALNFSDFSVVFLDQSIPSASVNSDTLVLSGDLLSDLLPFFLNESLVIAPFDFSRRHNPAECWSKASLSDLSGGPFHPYLERFGVECWDFDYDEGVVFTWAPSAKLDLSFNLVSTEDFKLFVRVFENAAGGQVAVYLDGLLVGNVSTRSQINGFVWRDVGVFNVTSDSHVLTVENIEGLNAVNLIAVIPEEKVSEMNQRFESSLQSRDLLYVFEAESDMLTENTSVSSGYGGEASNGAVVRLNSSSRVSRSVELVCDGNYSFAVRGSGNMLFRIDGISYEHDVNLEDFRWAPFGPVSLSSGKHEIEVSSLSGNTRAELDVLWLLKSNGNYGFWDEPTLDAVRARILNVKEIDPTKYVVEIDVDEPFMLCFSGVYDPAWTASFNGQTSWSTRVFGVANGFWINATGRVAVTVEFQPQRWFYIGLTISLTTLIILATGISCVWWTRKRKKKYLIEA